MDWSLEWDWGGLWLELRLVLGLGLMWGLGLRPGLGLGLGLGPKLAQDWTSERGEALRLRLDLGPGFGSAWRAMTLVRRAVTPSRGSQKEDSSGG